MGIDVVYMNIRDQCDLECAVSSDVPCISIDLSQCEDEVCFSGLFKDKYRLEEVIIEFGECQKLLNLEDMFVNCPNLRKVVLKGKTGILQSNLDMFRHSNAVKLRSLDISELVCKNQLSLNSKWFPDKFDFVLTVNDDVFVDRCNCKFTIIDNLNI